MIKAELYNQAHEVTIKWIAPDAIINDDYDFFHGLLKDLAEPNACKQVNIFNELMFLSTKVNDLIFR